MLKIHTKTGFSVIITDNRNVYDRERKNKYS